MPSTNRLIITVVLLLLAWPMVMMAQDKIDINRATTAQLSYHLKGIGPKKAWAIVQYRKQHGLFKTVDELQKVKGIGPKTIAKNRKKLMVNSEPKSSPANQSVR